MNKLEKVEHFSRWFGASKVVDVLGGPLVVYHGTDRHVPSFNPEMIGKNYVSSKAFYFIETPEAAAVYAYSMTDASGPQPPIAGIFVGSPGDAGRGGANTVPVYLSLQNPLIVTAQGTFSPDQWLDRHQEVIFARARRDGHDGIIVNPGSGFQYRGRVFVAFKPGQIVSAIAYPHDLVKDVRAVQTVTPGQPLLESISMTLEAPELKAEKSANLIRLLLQGLTDEARKVFEDLGPTDMQIQRLHDGFTVTVGGVTRPIDLSKTFGTLLSSIANAKAGNEWFQLVVEAGLAAPNDFDSPFFEILCTYKTENVKSMPIHFRGRFDSEVYPELSNGHVRNSALVLAFDEKRQESCNEAFRHVLCWASQRHVEEFPGVLTPYKPSLGISIKHAKRPVDFAARSQNLKLGRFTSQEALDIIDALAQPGETLGQDDLQVTHIHTGLHNVNGQICGGLDNALLAAYAPPAVQHGLASTPDRVLCRTTTDFLMNFPMSPVTEDELGHMRRQVAQVFPLRLMMTESKFSKHWQHHAPSMSTFMMPPIDLLKTISMDNTARALAHQALPMKLLRHCTLYRKDTQHSDRLEWYEMRYYSESLGLKPEEFLTKRVFVSTAVLDRMAAEGVRFPAGFQIHTDNDDTMMLRHRVRHCDLIFSMLDGPAVIDGVDTEMPYSKLLSRLAVVFKKKGKPTESLILMRLGNKKTVDEAVTFCKTANQWTACFKLFGDDAMVPYMDIASEAALTGRAMDVLGI
ncbi:hypothetical protein HNP46_000459 [Pseudomonas nitritireducens]|uniref:ART-PolyVal-like domain-containing protein n=1 Tax=Pseudomonas nitroreducens TaxID=46680 RepID=A0A7W7KGH2_PSENT|nr:hypothetical protein [Pseudomonas nitritireducens]